jgi:fructose-bisphosphate aldolase, class II
MGLGNSTACLRTFLKSRDELRQDTVAAHANERPNLVKRYSITVLGKSVYPYFGMGIVTQYQGTVDIKQYAFRLFHRANLNPNSGANASATIMIKERVIMTNQEKARELWERTKLEKFAVGAFNIDNQETLIAIAKAAKAKNSPVLVEVSKGEVEALGHANVRAMVDNYKAEYGIEMYVNLDHSPSVEDAKKGIEAGFEFIHIDLSQAKRDATDEEIIEATRQVVEYAKTTGALVESEPHYFGGSSNVHKENIDYQEIKKTFSTPEGAKAFAEATGIDTFAAAIGNLHGKYPVPKNLDIDLLQRIRQVLTCAISLHGGSGTPAEDFQKAIAVGVSKVNINSDMRFAYRTALEKVLSENPDEYAVVKLMPSVIAAVQRVVEDKIDMFGSAGRAKPS